MADGISKLPKDLIDKMIQYGLFNVEMWQNVVAKSEAGGREHLPKKFDKKKARIATEREVSLA